MIVSEDLDGGGDGVRGRCEPGAPSPCHVCRWYITEKMVGRVNAIIAHPRAGYAREYTCPPCTSATARMHGPENTKLAMAAEEALYRVDTYVFPSQSLTAFDTVNVPHCVISSGHLSVDGLAFYDVDTEPFGSAAANYTSTVDTYTTSNR